MTETQGWFLVVGVDVLAALSLVRFLLTRR